jgi:hypothetical protein
MKIIQETNCVHHDLVDRYGISKPNNLKLAWSKRSKKENQNQLRLPIPE